MFRHTYIGYPKMQSHVIIGTYRVSDISLYNHRQMYYNKNIHIYRVDDTCYIHR